MSAAEHPILPTNQSLGDVTDQLARIPLNFPTRRRWLIALSLSMVLLALFVLSAAVLFTVGVGVWGINIPVNWAFAIHNYVWWLGIGHAGTLISALLLLQPVKGAVVGLQWALRMHGFDNTDSSDTPIRDKAGGTIAPEAR